MDTKVDAAQCGSCEQMQKKTDILGGRKKQNRTVSFLQKDHTLELHIALISISFSSQTKSN